MLFVNGAPVADAGPHVSALDRGFTLGDGLFETMRAAGCQVYRWEAHRIRLLRGASVLHLPLAALYLERLLAAALRQAGISPAIVRLTITRGVDPGRGVAAPPHLRPTVVVRVTPLHETPARPLRGMLAATRRNERSPLSQIKSLSYGDSVLARLEAERRGFDDALLCNTRGHVACGTTSNVFALLNGRLVTPSLRSGALPGTTRAFVLAAARRLGLAASQRMLRPEELHEAQEVFLTNAVLGVQPLVALGCHVVGDGEPGHWTRAFARLHADGWALFVGRSSRSRAQRSTGG